MTDGLEVLVQLVMADITTEPVCVCVCGEGGLGIQVVMGVYTVEPR